MQLDLDYVRTRFPAFARPSQQGQAFFENAGGSFICQPVMDGLWEYVRETRVQPYYPYDTSQRAGEAMDASYPALARYLGVSAEWLTFGPSTSQNGYVLAQAFRHLLNEGDEVIVTNQDHEANSGVWRRLASDGVQVREWCVDPASGELYTEQLASLLSERTRLVCFPHCSNILGQINPVAEWTSLIRRTGAWSLVDGVSFAGHGFPDVAALGCDIYLFSLYKTYGPHQGLMVVEPSLADQLGNEAHYFNAGIREKRLAPAGPDHAQVAASGGIATYFDQLWNHHGGHPDEAAAGVRDLFHHQETACLSQLMDYLDSRSDIRIVGPGGLANRAPTVSVVLPGMSAAEAVNRLAALGVQCGGSHFYSLRLLQAMGLDPAQGVVRFSLVHYTGEDDVARLIGAMEKLRFEAASA